MSTYISKKAITKIPNYACIVAVLKVKGEMIKIYYRFK